MTKYDYAKLGLKAGLEVHQQLDTGKLFIRTPSKLTEETDFLIERKLRPVASELGEFDKSSLDAFKRNETFIYKGNTNNISLIELDEEPPQPIDKEALKTVLEVSLLCDSQTVDEAIVMRKTIIDGSNTSAFQRTMLVSIGGYLEIHTNNEIKKIGIETIALEEDAARPISKTNGEIIYNLDRLGIPLIELATAPDIKTPKEAIDTAKKIGEILRLTANTKRGKGTIRQDVNVSIKNGARIEIKGCQELELIETYIDKEIERQLDLIELKEELLKKFPNKKINTGELTELTKLFENTNCKFIKSKTVFGIKLNKMKGILGRKIGAKRLGSELSAYAKSAGVSGLLHRDELPNYGITNEEVTNICKKLECDNEDNFIIIVSEKEKAKKAFENIKERIITAFIEIPKETRGAEEDGSSTYQRPLSGGARMYPETDLKTNIISKELLTQIKKDLPTTLQNRIKLYQKWGLNENYINEMKLSNYARFFEKLVLEGANATTTATTLLQTLTELKRNNINIENITLENIRELLLLEKKGILNKNKIKDYLVSISKGKTIKEILENTKEVDTSLIEKEIILVINANKELIKSKGMGAIGPLMGDLMRKQELKEVDGKILSELLKKEIQKIQTK